MGKKKKMILIDGSNCFYRAFHAIPEFTNSKGLPTNAVYGFTRTLRKIINEYKPDYIAVAFDVRGKTVRHEKYEEYKATRAPMPDSLAPQVPYVKEMVRAFNVAVVEKEGYEADDVIATLAKNAGAEGVEVQIVSGDKDLFQLVDEKTTILDYSNEREYGPGEVREKFGVGPDAIRDMLALCGDSSDNVPGVPGVGPKTAVKLLGQFGSFDAVFENIDKVSGKKLKENLTDFKEQAAMSRELVTLHDDLPFDFNPSTYALVEPDSKALEKIFKELDFQKFYEEFAPKEASKLGCVVIADLKALKAWLKEIVKESLAISLLIDGTGVSGKLRGITLATSVDSICFVPLDASGKHGIEEALVLGAMKRVMEDASIEKITDDAKALYLSFLKHSIEPQGVVMDTSLASYLLNPSRSNHAIEKVAFNHFGVSLTELKPPYIDIDAEDLASTVAERLSVVIKAGVEFPKKLKAEGLIKLFNEMELPLAKVLAQMELAGIKVSSAILEKLSKELGKELKSLEVDIYGLAGCEFNINSPKQLSELLFVKMGIEPLKKTKTGFSTDESVLKALSEDYDIAQKILKNRQLAKLKSTFVDGIIALINPETGRVHTSFNQTVTATGRLSSSRPNLQNIPIRDENSSRVREAFVAEEGFEFLSADYSQIELRLVAHMSGDPMLIEAFRSGEDIHAITASEVFSIMPGLVTPEMRRRAKAINFGIIYGMGAFGLANDLEISVSEGQEYIDDYFLHYKLVKKFIDKTIKEALELGYTRTLFGRKRFIPELKSTSGQTRKFGERIAINSPVQGTAADMIKAAMIKIEQRMKEGSFRSRMILQVHDELIWEAVPGERARLEELVTDVMEGIIKLKVPVKVNIKSGSNWRSVE